MCRSNQPLLYELGQDREVGQGRLAAEEDWQVVNLTPINRETEMIDDQDKPLDVAQVLGERPAGVGQTTAKDALAILVTFAGSVALFAKEAEGFQEICAGLDYGKRLDPMSQTANAPRIRGGARDLHQDSESFLRDRRRWRPLAQERADGLPLTIERRGQVNPALMDLEQTDIARGEAGRAANLEIVAAGRSVRDDPVRQLDADQRLVLEVVAQPRGKQGD